MAGPYVLSGVGVQSVTPGAILLTTFTGPSSTVTTGHANPPNYYHVGLLTPGDGNGWYEAIPITHTPGHIVMPPGADRVGFSIDGVSSVTLSEVIPTPANWQKQPWDRNPQNVAMWNGAGVPANTPNSSAWSYTVPANRRFRWVVGEVQTFNYAPGPAANTYAYTRITLNGTIVLMAWLPQDATAPAIATLGGGPFDLQPGDVLSADWLNQNSATLTVCSASAAGYLFDP